MTFWYLLMALWVPAYGVIIGIVCTEDLGDDAGGHTSWEEIEYGWY